MTGATGARVLTALVLVVTMTGCARAGTGASADAATTPTVASREITVAAAADLRLAFGELGEAFEAATGTEVTFSFGSSGQLARQVVNGAPFDVFASADVALVDEVIAAGRADGTTRATYAFGRLAVYSPTPDGPTTLDALAAPEVTHVAIANPDHAPYGEAAEQALRRAGVYERVRPKLVLGENVADALRLATTGNAEAAVVALSLVTTRTDGAWTPVDQALHDPIEQALVATGVDPSRVDAARAFVAFVTSSEGGRVLQRYGFVPPGEQVG